MSSLTSRQQEKDWPPSVRGGHVYRPWASPSLTMSRSIRSFLATRHPDACRYSFPPLQLCNALSIHCQIYAYRLILRRLVTLCSLGSTQSRLCTLPSKLAAEMLVQQNRTGVQARGIAQDLASRRKQDGPTILPWLRRCSNCTSSRMSSNLTALQSGEGSTVSLGPKGCGRESCSQSCHAQA